MTASKHFFIIPGGFSRIPDKKIRQRTAQGESKTEHGVRINVLEIVLVPLIMLDSTERNAGSNRELPLRQAPLFSD